MRVFPGWPTWSQAEQELSIALPPETVSFLARAYAFADSHHEGQTRPGGEPYVEHLLEALEIVFRSAGVTDKDVLAAALLHDVVEDTPCTQQEVEDVFGAETARLVGWMTKPEGEAAADRERYLSGFAGAPTDVLTIKLADRYSNVQRLDTHPRSAKQRSYYLETCKYFLPLTGRAPFIADLFDQWRDEFSYLASDDPRPLPPPERNRGPEGKPTCQTT